MGNVCCQKRAQLKVIHLQWQCMLMTLLPVQALKTQKVVELAKRDWSLNSFKTHVLAKPQHTEAAIEIFKCTGITVTIEGECY